MRPFPIGKDWPTPSEIDATRDGQNLRQMTIDSGKRGGRKGISLHHEVANWPTPRAEDSEQVGNHLSPNPNAGDSLGATAKDWPTPVASNAERGSTTPDEKRGRGLETEAKSFANSKNAGSPSPLVPTTTPQRPTSSPDGTSMNSTRVPTLPDSKDSSKKQLWSTPKTPTGGPESRSRWKERGAGGEDLDAQVRTWATPTTRDLKDSPGQTVEENCLLGRQVQTDTRTGERSLGDGRKLNPLFDEWLIGWPIGWTCPCPNAIGGHNDFERWETAFIRSLQRWLSLYWQIGTGSEDSSGSRTP